MVKVVVVIVVVGVVSFLLKNKIESKRNEEKGE